MLKKVEEKSEENKSDSMLFCVCAFSCYMIQSGLRLQTLTEKYPLQVTAVLHWSFSNDNI